MAIQGYWNAGAIETAPDTSTLTSKGYPTSGDPKTGTPATKPGAAWYYLQDQMRNTVINAAGLQLSEPPSPTQFLEALQSLGWMKDAALTGKMIKDGEVTFAKLAAAAIATADQALAGTANNLLMTPQTAKLLVESLNLRAPAGTLIPYIGTTVPTGYLLANGAEVSRTKYADLFAAIGTKFGVGDGATTFGLPNMNGRFIEGTTSMSEVGKYVEAGLPNITGAAQLDTNETGKGLIFFAEGAFGQYVSSAPNAYASYASEVTREIHGNFTLDAARSSSTYGASTVVQPPALMALALIKI